MITASGIVETMIGGVLTIGFGWLIREFFRLGLLRYRLHRTRKLLRRSLSAINTLAQLQKFVLREEKKHKRTIPVLFLEDRLELYRLYIVEHEYEINRLAVNAKGKRPYFTTFDLPYRGNVNAVVNHYSGAMGNAFSNDCTSLHESLRFSEHYYFNELHQSLFHSLFAKNLVRRIQ